MSGYGEASGHLVFKADETLREKIMASDSVSQEAVEALFEHYGIDPGLSKNMGFGVNDRKIIDDYVHLQIFDGSWIEIAKLLIGTKTGKEVIAKLWDDYGGIYYMASNDSDHSIIFDFEEDSEEMDQDDFDEEAYYLEYEKNKEKWSSMIPDAIRNIFE